MGICPTCNNHEHGHCFQVQMTPRYTHGSRGSRSFVKERHDHVEVKEIRIVSAKCLLIIYER